MIKNNKIKFHATSFSHFCTVYANDELCCSSVIQTFCQVTGYGGTPMVSENNMVKGDFGEINVRFDSSTEKDSPVFFKPVKKN